MDFFSPLLHYQAMAQKGQKKTGKALRQSRQADSLSEPVKDLGGYEQAEHLGNKQKHDEDALRQEAWIRRQKAAKLGVSPEDLDESVELADTAALVGFSGSDRDEGIIKRTDWDDCKLRDDVLGTKGLVISMAFVGEPGHRQWEDLEGSGWVLSMMAEKKLRANYYTSSRNPVTNGPKPLQVILARLPPWVGSTVAPTLLEDPLALKKRLVRLCEEFSNRYNVDVVGAVVHRESDYDLHVHLVFSQTRERVRPKKLGVRKMRDEIKKVRDRIRADLRSHGKPATNKAVAAVFKEMEESRILTQMLNPVRMTESVRYERIRQPDEKVRRSTLGHAFLCKMQTWRAADVADKDAVAAFRDKTPDHPRFDRSFQSRFAGAETRGEVLEDLWWNLWVTDRWRELCLEGLSPEIVERSAAKGREMAKDYLMFGSTVPTLTERLSVEKCKLEEHAHQQKKKIEELESDLTADAGEAEALKKQVVELRAEREQLSAERNQFKTEAAQKNSLLAQVQATFGVNSEEKLVPDLKRVASEAKQVPKFKNRIETLENELGLAEKSLGAEREKVKALEKEIGSLRRLKELAAELIPHLIEPKFYANLTKGMIKRLTEMASIIGFKFDISGPEM
ncbi:MAG: hypothetical protein WCH98_02175 [Verrucomicrobiota bacterium]